MVFAILWISLDEFPLVEMCFFWFPCVKKRPIFFIFTCKSLPRCRAKLFQLSTLVSDFLIQVSSFWMFGRQCFGNIFLQSRPAAVEAFTSMCLHDRKCWSLDKLHLAMLGLVNISVSKVYTAQPRLCCHRQKLWWKVLCAPTNNFEWHRDCFLSVAFHAVLPRLVAIHWSKAC